MPQDIANPSAAASLGSGMDGEQPTDQKPDEQAIHIPVESLPQGIKEGDCLRCTGVDESGGTFTMEPGESAGEDGTPWEEDFRKEMSPRSGQEAS